MRATLPLTQIADRVRALLRDHRAALRARVYDTPALNAPAGPCEVLPVTTADGARLRVHAYGPADGDVIVLVHGWSCCIEYWNPQINAFAGEYRVIAYDQRAHGGSEPGTAPLTPDTLADDLESVLSATLRPGQRAVLVGHSMGGMTIQAWAGRYPERVEQRASAVLLTNTAPGDLIAATTVLPFCNRGSVSLPFAVGRRLLGTPLLLPPIEPMKWIIRRQVMSLTCTGEIAAFSQAILRSCPARVRARFGLLLADLALGRSAANLTVPTTILAGEFDDMTPVVHAERIADMLRSAGSLARFEILPTGHLGNVEAYEAFNEELRRVLTETYTVREASA
ncbi:pimeloyl-ACP methyl ester carboxylesterase [Nocardia transvalensis]|uniref:Pimeloyl-ACP methyl ester carboxylesterase n=1 Tax=Nocardia transvalensis TaxID=37333 RepID=A0A7W9PEE0_9NOCA|nr:alpha/beta hydrolase [Nocardia transvalensis]MBB5914365.1 pimeloyl-ACP methyl ester carboxylesterase [Nocardia transvalensis]